MLRTEAGEAGGAAAAAGGGAEPNGKAEKGEGIPPPAPPPKFMLNFIAAETRARRETAHEDRLI